MADAGLTVREVAERIVLTDDPDDLARTVEQLRYWTREELLHPIGRKHSGTGRWRRYGERQVYAAAVWADLARRGLSIAALKLARTWLVLDALDLVKGGRDPFDVAIQGAVPVHLFRRFGHGDDEPWGGLVIGERALVSAIKGQSFATLLVVNLSEVFRRVRPA